jgi:hypothetical protein
MQYGGVRFSNVLRDLKTIIKKQYINRDTNVHA